MYKRIALLALLLPFSGYSLCKKERKQKQERMTQIIKEVKDIEFQVNYLDELIKHNAWIIFLSGDSLRQSYDEARTKTIELNKEYEQLQKELS